MSRAVRIRTAAVIVFAAALAVRLGIGVFLGFQTGPDQAACGADTIEFEQMAWSAASGEGFRLHADGDATAFRAPGYPLLLSVVYRLVGRAYWANRVLLSVLGALTCVMVYALALRLTGQAVVAFSAALLTAALPLQFYWCGHFMSEPLAAFLNVATVLLLVRAPLQSSMPTRSRTHVLTYLAAGVLCGLAALTRPAALLMLPILAVLWAISRNGGWKRWIASVAFFALGIALAVAPWTIRNRIVLDRWALIATNGGSTFWGANNDIVARPGAHWGSWVTTTRVDRERKEAEVWSLANEVDRDKAEWRIGLEWVRENPEKVPMLLAGKFWRLLKPFPDSPNRIYVLATALGWILLLPTSLLGLCIVLQHREMRGRFIPLHAQLLTLLATTMIFYGSERFRAPYEPFLAVFTGVGVVHLWKRMAAKRRGIHKSAGLDCGGSRRNQGHLSARADPRG